MGERRDDEDDPTRELLLGLTHLWRAARGAASEVRREMARTDVGKALDDASRELARAATNVVDRLVEEVSGPRERNTSRGTEQPGGAPPPARPSAAGESEPGRPVGEPDGSKESHGEGASGGVRLDVVPPSDEADQANQAKKPQ